MNFLGLSERINTLLYHKQVEKLSRRDGELARTWTLQLIREAHPLWTEQEVERYYENLLKIRVVAVDQWGKRHGGTGF
ncbi:MAG: hypothetical protein HC904_05485 [Blastochloris sp.]|nr:hypothetical protein [Blastochloris sp.]